MKKQLVNVSKLQAAKVAAAIYLVISVPMVLLMMLPALFSDQPGLPLWLLLLLPVLYAVLGFVFTFVAAWIYNLVASKIGGLEYTTVEVEVDA